MGQRQYLLLVFSILFLVPPEFRLWAAESRNHRHFEELFLKADPCQSGLEVSDYRRLRIYVEELPANTEVACLTKRELQTKCELRLRQAGIEPVADKDEYLSVKVDLVRGAYAMSVRLVRPILFRTNEIVYRKPGAGTWKREIVGYHGGNARYIIEGLDSLLDDFISEYLKANSK